MRLRVETVERAAQLSRRPVLFLAEPQAVKRWRAARALAQGLGRELLVWDCVRRGEAVERDRRWLFGYTDSYALIGTAIPRRGMFGEASGQVLLLDEAEELALELQGEVLDAHEHGEVRGLGESDPRAVDVVLILGVSSMSRVESAVAAGKFDERLFTLRQVVAGAPQL